MASRTVPPDQPTPGCNCSHCRILMDIERNGAPDGKAQMGKVQYAGRELGWRDYGADSKGDKMFGHLSPVERLCKEERERTGKPLVAGYRHLLGPTPQLRPGDTEGATAYLSRIESAIEHGGWTRSEATRLRRLRDKWKARATGADPRYKEVGNRQGGLTPHETANVKLRRTVERIRQEAENGFRSQGD